MEMTPIDMPSFLEKAQRSKRSFRRFLTRMQEDPVKGLAAITAKLEPEVWGEVDCLGCANCCKTMTPTFTPADIKRIAAHFGQTTKEFKDKWLRKERNTGDWLNKKEPCQFLDLKDNKCSIYAVRPADCAGFPHLPKRMNGYGHVHKQNIEYCPATYRMVEKMMMAVKGVKV